MALTFSDTFPDLDSDQLKTMRAMPIWEKFRILDELDSQVRLTILDRLREHYPHEKPEKIRRRFATVWLGAELAARV